MKNTPHSNPTERRKPISNCLKLYTTDNMILTRAIHEV
jgi:hypothetical protein